MTDTLTVAIVTPWDRKGGIANYSNRLANELEKLDVEVEPVPIHNPESSNPLHFGDILNRIPPDADIIHVQFEAGLFGRLGISGIGAPWFFNQLRRVNKPVVTTLHEIHAAHNHRGKAGDYLLRVRDWIIERLVLRVSDVTVVHTRESERILRDRHGTNPRIQRHLLPAEQGNEPVSLETAKDRFNLSGPTLLTLGWIEPKKQFQDIVRVLPKLPEVTYFVVGDPRPGDQDAFEDARRLAEKLGVQDRVVRHEYVTSEDFNDVYGAADAVVLPYRRVSVSIAVNEALSYRKPTVASSLPYFEELSEKYDCVLTYRTQSELEEALKKALYDSDVRDKLRNAAAKYVERINWTQFAAWTRRLYTDVKK